MSKQSLVSRKNDHLDIVLDPTRAIAATGTGFGAFRFEHCALPELHLDQIDLLDHQPPTQRGGGWQRIRPKN